jgi:hypothetical protein
LPDPLPKALQPINTASPGLLRTRTINSGSTHVFLLSVISAFLLFTFQMYVPPFMYLKTLNLQGVLQGLDEMINDAESRKVSYLTFLKDLTPIFRTT